MASTRRSLEDETRAWTRSAAPRTTCSQLSRTSSAGPEPSTPRMPDTGSPEAGPFMAPAPSTEATSAATSASSVTPASGTKYTRRCSARRLTACASRVLPSPPGPTTVTARETRNSPSTAAMSSSRPSSGFGSCGTPCLATGASPRSNSCCTALSPGPGSVPSSSRSSRRYASYRVSAADGPAVAASPRSTSPSTSSSRGCAAAATASGPAASAWRPRRASASARARTSVSWTGARSARRAATGSSLSAPWSGVPSQRASPASAAASEPA